MGLAKAGAAVRFQLWIHLQLPPSTPEAAGTSVPRLKAHSPGNAKRDPTQACLQSIVVERLPAFGSHISTGAIVSCTSHRSQHDLGSYLGPYTSSCKQTSDPLSLAPSKLDFGP